MMILIQKFQHFEKRIHFEEKFTQFFVRMYDDIMYIYNIYITMAQGYKKTNDKHNYLFCGADAQCLSKFIMRFTKLLYRYFWSCYLRRSWVFYITNDEDGLIFRSNTATANWNF
jgi:hypothetical protein